jgi:hypothetical protein
VSDEDGGVFEEDLITDCDLVLVKERHDAVVHSIK